ncbi:DUF456 domain-containing protein [Streptomyces virginiae]|uniref:DUF456 domain-containing protein n=1 Tax=Streptomyces virginiae TaxID=1961 RepID=UPI0033338216
MDVPQLLLVGLVLLFGLVGVLVPGVPGTLLVWAGLMWWALHERSALSWSLLVAATAVLLVAQVVKWQLPPRQPRGLPVTPRTAVFAGAGAVLGFVLLPVVGTVPGFVCGVYLCERLRLGELGEAWASTRAVMRAVGTSVLVELFACLLVVGAWVGAVAAG